MKTPLSSIMLVLMASLIGSIAAVMLKSGANRMGRPWRHWSGRIVAGVVLFLISSVLYVMGLREGSLTVLYPMVSMSYVWILLWSRIFFGEQFNRPKVVGLLLLLVGVVFIGIGNE